MSELPTRFPGESEDKRRTYQLVEPAHVIADAFNRRAEESAQWVQLAARQVNDSEESLVVFLLSEPLASVQFDDIQVIYCGDTHSNLWRISLPRKILRQLRQPVYLEPADHDDVLALTDAHGSQ